MIFSIHDAEGAGSLVWGRYSLNRSLWRQKTFDSLLAFFPRLLPVIPEQGSKVILSGGGIGLPWDEIDENSSVKAYCILESEIRPNDLRIRDSYTFSGFDSCNSWKKRFYNSRGVLWPEALPGSDWNRRGSDCVSISGDSPVHRCKRWKPIVNCSRSKQLSNEENGLPSRSILPDQKENKNSDSFFLRALVRSVPWFASVLSHSKRRSRSP